MRGRGVAKVATKRESRLAGALDAWWRPAAFLVAVVFVWWIVTAAGWIKPYLIPSPFAVLGEFSTDGALLARSSAITLYETVIGFVLAAIVGLACAVAIVYSRSVERTLYPLLLVAQVVPKIAIAPLFVVWLGFGLLPKILVAVLIAFFPVVISSVAGLRSVDPELIDLAATMGASPLDSFAKIRFPAALPQIFAGLKVAVTLAVVGAVVGEFVGANSGLGYVVLSANGNLNTPLLFAGLIAMSLIGIVLFVVLEIAERIALPWRAERGGAELMMTS
jgi:NitT/TauT family transport system permease protein